MKSMQLGVMAWMAAVVLGAVSPIAALATEAEEEWKGRAPAGKATLGALMGVGLESGGHFALMGAAAWMVDEDGFIPEITDQAYIETEMGAGFGKNSRFLYSVHMRWDFVRNRQWTPFVIAGLSGGSGGDFTLAPRFGIGSFWQVSEGWTVRGEISRDLILAGVSFGF